MEAEIKKQIIKSVKSVKNKIKQMNEREHQFDSKRQKIFKPITDSLQVIASNNFQDDRKKLNESFSESVEDSVASNVGSDKDEKLNANVEITLKTPQQAEHYRQIKTPSNNSVQSDYKTLNVTFGVRNDGGKLMMGNLPISFNSDGDDSSKISMITVGKNSYEMTPGLAELLFQNKPNIEIINEKDKLVYKDILIYTNAHKRAFCSTGQIQGNSGMKYCKIIKPLFFESDSKNVKEGGRLPTLKQYKPNVDLIYWDDPNELIDRLKVLIASKSAGNTNHDNEIISIIEELKEAGIIKE